MNDLLIAASKLMQNPMALVLLIISLIALFLLWSIQAARDNFDLRWLITDNRTHQPSVHKMGELVALVMSTWLLVYQTLNNRMTENYFLAYMAIWTGSQVANSFVSAKYNPIASTTTSSTTVSSTTASPVPSATIATEDVTSTGPSGPTQP